ncbi:hypothetical protein I350_05845, partial [Cryptococcus amylolentus CBS 6273]
RPPLLLLPHPLPHLLLLLLLLPQPHRQSTWSRLTSKLAPSWKKNRLTYFISSYEAGEDNEISFAEGDHITDIDKVDPDWWQGTCNGKEGLFPAAYVVGPDEYPLQD